MNYIDRMQDLAFERLDLLHKDITEVAYTDFPDHGNVGDSAIALGQLHYYKARGIRIASTTSYATSPDKFKSNVVVIHGGGNLGDIYPHHHGYRLRVGRTHKGTVIQAPQSVHFGSQSGLEEYLRIYNKLPGYRIGLRDANSLTLLKGLDAAVLLCPDSFHCLGYVEAPDPSQKYLVLARTDTESGSLSPTDSTVDWPAESGLRSIQARLRNRSKVWPAPARSALNMSTHGWAAVADRRFRRGVTLLATAEVIITDRLHAMLMALQMGRSVVAIDNNNRKLQNYAETWFGDVQPNVRFAMNINEARNLVH